MDRNCYTTGDYLDANPGWHQDHSRWKADHILPMVGRHAPQAASICEVGCGAGEICRLIADTLPATEVVGFDISPQAIAIAAAKAQRNLRFSCGEAWGSGRGFDLALAIDVMEHVEDYFTFLRRMKDLAPLKLYHIPLEISAQNAVRGAPFLRNWRRVGHLHVFTKDTALEALVYTNHDIVEWHYTGGADAPHRSRRAQMLSLPRRLLSALAPDAAARLFGGYSMLVLCR